jgi:WD40 repeat protein
LEYIKEETMKFRVLIFFSAVFIFFTVILSNCVGASPTSDPITIDTTSVLPLNTNTPTETQDHDLEVIKPDNLNRLELIDRWGQGYIYGVALSPDKGTIAVAATSGIYLYDTDTLRQEQFINFPIIINDKNKTPSQPISFSPDGSLLAIGFEELYFWNLTSNRWEDQIDFRLDDYGIVQIAFAPHGETIGVMSRGGYAPCDSLGGNFALYDIETEDLLFNEYFCPESSLFHFGFLENGNVFFVGVSPESRFSSDFIYRISFVDSKTGLLLNRLDFDGYIDSISPDGTILSVRRRREDTEIIDIASLQALDQATGIVYFLPDNERRILSTRDGWAIINSNQDTVCKFDTQPKVQLNVYRSAFTLMEDMLVYKNNWDQSVEIWDLASCELAKRLFVPSGDHSLEFSNKGEYLATNGVGNIHIIDGRTGIYKFSIPGRYNVTPTIYFDFSDESSMAVVSQETPYTISIWDLVAEEKIQSIPTNLEYFYEVSLSLDGSYVTAYGRDGLYVWDVKSGELINTLQGEFSYIQFSPDKKQFALREDNEMLIYNATDGLVEKKIAFPDAGNVTFSKDWSKIVFDKYDEEEELELWDIHGLFVREFTVFSPISFQIGRSKYDYGGITYQNKIFSPDNGLLAATYRDDDSESEFIRFWDTETGEIIRDIRIPFRYPEIEFSPDGRRLLLMGNGVIYVFGIEISE